MDILLQDVRYSARKLARAPGFTLVAVLTLALAIGATTAVFSVVNGVLLKPLPFADPERLVRVGTTTADGRMTSMSPLDFIDYRDQSRAFVGMASVDVGDMNLTGAGSRPQRVNAARVGARFFELLGVGAQLGRVFAPGDDAQGAPPLAVLSDALWKGRFGSDAGVVGRVVSLDGRPYTVIGVAPPTLTYPQRPDVWIPKIWETWELDPRNRGSHSLSGIARLGPGTTVERGRREIATIASRLARQYPESNTGFIGMVQPLQEQIVGKVRPALLAMLGAVAFVLLIACANVANLLLVRAAARESEIAVRTALGAGRGRLVRQLVTESVLLALAGAVLGALLASWAVDAVVAFGPRRLPRLDEVAVDGHVLLFAAAIAVATGIAFGLVPALQAARPDIGQVLNASVRGTSRGGAQRTRSALVMSEMALAVVLLVGAGLLIRSFTRLIRVDPGFRTENVVTFSVTLPDAKYPFDRDKRALLGALVERLRALPGTQAVGVVFNRPMGRRVIRTVFDVAGRAPNPPEKRTPTGVQPASPDYFRALNIPLVRGRLYTPADDRPDAPPVVVVSEEFVRRYFPGEDPIGKRITLGVTHDTAQTGTEVTAQGEIVGIVGDVRETDLAEPAYPTTYLPYNTLPLGDVAVLVRSTAGAELVEGAARTVLRELDADLPIYDMRRLTEVIAESVSQPRFYTLLLAGFAAIALVLAAVGIYGVISYAVTLRTRELGIRVALGASSGQVVRMVLGQGFALTLAGVAVGLGAAFLLTRVIASLLFGVGALDPLTYGAVAGVLLGVAALASYVPARRAARVDPLLAMRAE
ncbi:MAG: ABC transporter permease [Gemmatimonadaceae bacterium]